jgi:succinate dehydrogenase / fumarate reductase flavoprotein subunit
MSAEALTEGFFAAGECACVSVHGANRLGSNSLLECVVYGRRVGKAIAEYISNRQLPDLDERSYLRTAENRLQSLLCQSGSLRIAELRQQWQDCLTEHCGVFRSAETMSQGLEKLQHLKQQYQHIYLDDKERTWNTELIEALELENIMVVGEIILASALQRQESRGAHAREDYPSRDDNRFLRHTLAAYTPAGIDINYMPVVINLFTPQERKY